jgi:hypothetical protein
MKPRSAGHLERYALHPAPSHQRRLLPKPPRSAPSEEFKMKFVPLFLAVAALTCVAPANAGTFGEDCRAYAKAIFAVAEARDNLDDPSWKKLLELHPILKEIEKKEGRGFLYAQMINLRMINKNASPRALMTNSYDQCISGTAGFCMLYNQGCGPKGDSK